MKSRMRSTWLLLVVAATVAVAYAARSPFDLADSKSVVADSDEGKLGGFKNVLVTIQASTICLIVLYLRLQYTEHDWVNEVSYIGVTWSLPSGTVNT